MATPPSTRTDAITETLHGVTVADPYRWLEDEHAPEVQAWMSAQDEYTRAELAKLPGRDELAARFRELFYYDAVSAPAHCKGRYFYTRKHADNASTAGRRYSHRPCRPGINTIGMPRPRSIISFSAACRSSTCAGCAPASCARRTA